VTSPRALPDEDAFDLQQLSPRLNGRRIAIREEDGAMYATFRYYAGGEALVDELVGKEGEVKSLIQGIPGFRAYYLIKTDKGDAVSLSVYDDRSGAEESNRAAAEWVRGNLPGLSIGTPQISAGEVAIQA
jgi:hypothetical protein